MPTASMAVPPRTSILSLISFLHDHLHALLADPDALLAARQRCLAMLGPPPHHGRTQSSDKSDDEDVLAAFHSAIDAFHPASGAFDGACCLAGVEEALQAPALLPEHGETAAGLDNRRVAACAYFYLALVRCAQGDAWQCAMHFLQAVAVSPAVVAGEDEAAGGLATRTLWEGLFDEGVLARAGGAGEEDAVRCAARRYKDWLMYYKVVAAIPGPVAGAGSDG